jgi:hypothetical protein
VWARRGHAVNHGEGETSSMPEAFLTQDHGAAGVVPATPRSGSVVPRVTGEVCTGR